MNIPGSYYGFNSFTAVRKPGHHLENIVIPLYLLALLSSKGSCIKNLIHFLGGAETVHIQKFNFSDQYPPVKN